jgi:hypothetical protein
MPFIRETIVTTRRAGGDTHIAPMGVHERGAELIVAPFRPSATLENLQRNGCAVINYPDDVRVYAGCLTGRREWPLCDAERVPVMRLRDCLAHTEIQVSRMEDDELRPRFHCRIVHEATHAPFHGFNRAQAAVIEAAILVSRLHMLNPERIEREIAYLRIAVDKTAGEREREAWGWLMAAIAARRHKPSGPAP